MQDGPMTRIKCAMLVYELERALGRYVREHANQLEKQEAAQEILKRSNNSKLRQDEVTQAIVENSYLGEILALAHGSARNTSEAVHFSELEKLASALTLFEIRNAVSHPNRRFPECYWYRCAAIAADPLIDALGFYEVSLALQNANDGKLLEPPEDWLYKKRWAVPTVLPSEFEHSITGLFGRQKDSFKLTKELKNQRAPLIALIARGGVGKTSLLLQVVSDFCLSAEAPQFFDGVLWASFKQERLTSAGIEILSAPQGLKELETILCLAGSEIFGLEISVFSQMKEQLSTKRLLLCLDNLETLLRDSPAEFDEFYEELPENWKVVVTSRIPVDNAKNVPVDVLDRSGSLGFARAYLTSRGAPSTEEAVIERICAGALDNPLAIRLTIEMYLAGAELSEALQRSGQELLNFSFTNLLERLSSLENDLLEVVFVLEQPSRAAICGALDVSADKAAEAISKLAKISLVVRQEVESKEIYVLGASIRDLLRANPRNLNTRSRIILWVSRSRSMALEAQRAQLEFDLKPVELNYFPSSADPSLSSVCKQIKAAVKRDDRSALVSLEVGLRNKLDSQPSPLLHRLYAWTSFELTDVGTAVTHFKQATALDKDDPAPQFGLALALQIQGNWEDLKATTKNLIENEWGTVDKAGVYHANRIWALYLQSLSILEEHTTVIELTEKWNDHIYQIPAFAFGRACVYRRMADAKLRSAPSFSPKDARDIGELIGKSAYLMLKVLIVDGFLRWYLFELRKLFQELIFQGQRGVDIKNYPQNDQETIQTLLKFCLSTDAIRAGLVDFEVRGLFNRLFPTKVEVKSIDLVKQEQLLENGFLLVKVKNGGRPESSYIFAQDENGTDYFVRLEIFEDGDQRHRNLLIPGAKIAIKFDPKDTGNAFRATEARLLTE